MSSSDQLTMTERRSVTRESSHLTGQGVASLVLGAFAVAVSFLPVLGVPALILGPLAIIFAIMGRNRRDTALATAGLILGVVGTSIALIVTVLTLLAVGTGLDKYNGLLRNVPAVSAPAAAGPAEAPPRHSAAAVLPPSEAAGQPPGKNCGGQPADAEGGQPVTFVVDGEPGKKFNVDYGTPAEYGCVEGVTGHWEVTRAMKDPTGVGITMWSDPGNEQMLSCRIVIGGRILNESNSSSGGGCSG